MRLLLLSRAACDEATSADVLLAVAIFSVRFSWRFHVVFEAKCNRAPAGWSVSSTILIDVTSPSGEDGRWGHPLTVPTFCLRLSSWKFGQGQSFPVVTVWPRVAIRRWWKPSGGLAWRVEIGLHVCLLLLRLLHVLTAACFVRVEKSNKKNPKKSHNSFIFKNNSQQLFCSFKNS